jgi:hypothetical protein
MNGFGYLIQPYLTILQEQESGDLHGHPFVAAYIHGDNA